MKRQPCIPVILFGLLFVLSSWGEKGHLTINRQAASYLPKRITKGVQFALYLTEHGSDPDQRKKDDPNEGRRHFIDIDAYSDFQQNHSVEKDASKAMEKYGKAFLLTNGILPWVTDSVYHELVDAFKSKSWPQILRKASDLGHYVADSHMPLHLTTNYDGQLTNQKGIHSRYESKMINQHINEIQFTRFRHRKIKSVDGYLFQMCYNNYSYKDSLLIADLTAFSKSSKYDEQYYTMLWNRTELVTEQLIDGASQALANLIWQAWIDAGRPRLPRNKVEKND